MKQVIAAVATVAASATVLCASITFTATWKSMDAGNVTFVGKKVAALVISNDDSLRVAGEESLVRELSALGMQAVATYRIAPAPELRAPETAKVWFDRAGIEGVVAVRPVSADTRQVYTPDMWVSSSYSSLWGYYGYGWGAVYVPGSSERVTQVVVETTIYSVPKNELLWGAVTQSTNPRDLRQFVAELAKASVKVLREQGLAKGQPR
jgi:hypothetical protein